MSKEQTITDKLTQWYHREGRDLPFRRTADPYAIWVSEVMLQQTQVKTMLPYYERFMARFPSVKALSAAPLDDVLKLWQGLGYYSRARNLHKGAAYIVDSGGQIPNTKEQILKIPGIGEYTAGAILSICFDQREPAIDGNAIRVLSRLYTIGEGQSQAHIKKTCYHRAKSLLSHTRPSIFNQALMELGALICTPKSPSCSDCPLQSHCLAFLSGQVDKFPLKNKMQKAKKIYRAIFIIRSGDGRYLIHKRSDSGLLAGLWEFPGIDFDTPFDDTQAISALHSTIGVVDTSIVRIGAAKHAFSHIHWHMTLYHVKLEKKVKAAKGIWATKQEIGERAFPSALRAALDWINE